LARDVDSEHPWAETARQAREMKMLNICGSLVNRL
jgi:hypothetical protein